MSDYAAFLRAKVQMAESFGFEIDDADINPLLKPFQKATVRWAVAGGRRAVFKAFGLGKTFDQIEIVRITRARAGGMGLIVLPLGVRQEFMRDANTLNTGGADVITAAQRAELADWHWHDGKCDRAVTLTFVRSIEECTDPEGIYLTNYETVRDGKLDPRLFSVASLDEADCLRGFGGSKTFREFMALFAGDDRRDLLKQRVRGTGVRYRFVATATPSPNEYVELLAYCAYLGVMDVGQAKTRFFKRDSTKADALTIHPHKEREFWLWMASWALFVQRPSDLDPSFSDDGYVLPELDVRWHEIPSDHDEAGADMSGQARMFKHQAIGIVEASREKRDSLQARVAKLQEIRAEAPAAHRIIWHDLEDERRAIERVLPRARYGQWLEHQDGNAVGLALFERHYSALPYDDGRERDRFAGPGYKTVLLTEDEKALFVWRKFIDDSGQQGINCAVFRNEGPALSSDLIKEAMAIAWQRWPGERFYTYVNAKKVRSSNPGFCFLQAGWRRCGVSKTRGLVILEMRPGWPIPGTPMPDVVRRPVAVSVFGTQPLDEREAHVIAFSDGDIQELVSKPVLLGSGCNFQRHCAWEVFLGIGFKFKDFIQAIHRCHRFLQPHQVRIDLIYTEAEREVRRSLERKWAQDKELRQKMTAIIREYGLSRIAMANVLMRKLGVERVEVKGAGWTLVNNDCVDETRRMASNKVGLILTSIPFSTQYEYSPNYADFGHTDNNAHFFQQMDFLVPELLRVLMPGRLAAIHVKNRIVPSGMVEGVGFQTEYPFDVDTIQCFRRHGFHFVGRKTIVTDVVRENNQTYRLGWSEQCKDGSRMGFGMNEYLLLFRKAPTDASRGYADVPVVKSKAKYSRARWQFDAHGFARSSGDRRLTPDELINLPHDVIFKLFRQHSLEQVYDFEHDVRIGEALGDKGMLPTTFMLLQPQSWSDEVWTDITRMRTLNGAQSAAGREMHLCPMQLDLADRAIAQYSNEGDEVYDPFNGIGTVTERAVRLGRYGRGCELAGTYFADSTIYCKAAERERSMPSLFDADELEAA